MIAYIYIYVFFIYELWILWREFHRCDLWPPRSVFFSIKNWILLYNSVLYVITAEEDFTRDENVLERSKPMKYDRNRRAIETSFKIQKIG